MGKDLRALIVEDSHDDTALLVRALERGGYAVRHERVDTAAALRAALNARPWDIVFADYTMPRFDGVSALKVLRDTGLDLPFIFVSGSIGEDTAVEAMKAGAHDYIMKANLKRLLPAVERELREAELRRAHQQAEALIQRMAYYDPLTELPNRNRLHDRLLNAIRLDDGQGTPMAVLLLDLDRFRAINNTLGYDQGDLLLQQVGVRLRGVFEEPALVARLSGDEFAILLPQVPPAVPIHALVEEKVMKALEAPFLIRGLPLSLEASIGIALYPDHGATPASLLQRADVALDAAKRLGGAVLYSAEHDQHDPLQLALLGALRQAIGDNQLLLYYQPKIDCTTRRVTGVEALARWRHPEYGFIPPDQFIPPAEQTGLIKPLTVWALTTAVRQCAAWHAAGIELEMAVNISARSLHDLQLLGQISELLNTQGMAARTLRLEITESTIMEDAGRAIDILKRMREIGIHLSLDDFGTGYSSLGYLKKLPVDEVKIDKSFVKDLLTSGNAEAIVRSTIDLGHHLGLTVVAEGVEDEEVWNRLAALGCDAAQGYYMGRPLPADALTTWLDESPWGFRPPENLGAEAA